MSPLNPNEPIKKWVVGLDIGSATTAYAERRLHGPNPSEQRSTAFPTVVGYPRRGDHPGNDQDLKLYIGKEALARYDHLELVFPLEEAATKRFRSFADFAHGICRPMQLHRRGQPWGVVSQSAVLDATAMQELRAVVSDLFDRVTLVDETTVATAALFRNSDRRCGIVVDLGATATRAALLSGSVPADSERVSLPGGGNAADKELKDGLGDAFPDLLLSDVTIRLMKEKIGFVSPEGGRRTLSVMLHDVARELDVTPQVRAAGARLARDAVDGIQKVLTRCPSDYVEQFVQNVFLFGGGANARGLVEAVQGALSELGLEAACVRKAERPSTFVADAALSWGLALEPQHWQIPLFSFQESFS